MCRRIVAWLLVCALAAANGPARAAGSSPIAVVTQSIGAHIGSAALSPGATVYDGDHLSTEAGGGLHVRSAAARLFLPGQSAATLRSTPSGPVAELLTGTIVFSAAKAPAIEVLALGSRMRPVGDGPTVAQVSIAGPKMLHIVVRQGTLRFTYREESEAIPEGSSIRVLLDPSEQPGVYPPYPKQQTPKPGRLPRGFLFLVWGGVGVATWIVVHEALESPDRP